MKEKRMLLRPMTGVLLAAAIVTLVACCGKKANPSGGGTGGSGIGGGLGGGGGAAGSVGGGGETIASGGTVGSGGIVSNAGAVSPGGTVGLGGASGGMGGNGGSLGGRPGGATGGVSSSGGVTKGGTTGASTRGSAGTSGTGGKADGGVLLPDGGVDSAVGRDALTGVDGSAATWWKPTAGTTWQWQIGGGTIDPALEVQVFDIDWEEDASTVLALHQAGKKVVCYLSVGSWEDWRPDAADLPAATLGKDYPGWPGEKFIDIRSDAVRAVMAKRLDLCKQKGFDAVEPDNMDVFEAGSGFPLTRKDGVDYALWLASQSHQRGMAIVQKNASSIVADIHESYDGGLTEDCYADGWCSDMQPYIDANQPVFACEYTTVFSAACAWGQSRKYSFIMKELELNAWIQFCP